MGVCVKGSKSGSADLSSACHVEYLRTTIDGNQWPELKSFLETGFISEAEAYKMLDQMERDGGWEDWIRSFMACDGDIELVAHVECPEDDDDSPYKYDWED